MGLLVAGVLIWIIAHLFPSFAPDRRAALIQKMGKDKYRGLFALFVLISLALIVIGWRNTTPTVIYDPPSWGRHLAMLLMLFAVYCFAASHGSSNLKRFIGHPMLTGMMIWSIAHLLANGTSRDVILFGAMGLWAFVARIQLNRRDGPPQKPAQYATPLRELGTIAASLVVYIILVYAHRWFTGVPLIPSMG